MEILETFPRVFCFLKSRINKNGGKISYKIFHNSFRVINGIKYRYTCMIAFSVQAVCGIAYKSMLLGCEDWL